MEDNLTTYKGVRIDDTAEWRLAVYITETGMSAYLKNTENPLEPVATLFEEQWQQDETALLRNIETDRKSTRLNSSHIATSRMPSSA